MAIPKAPVKRIIKEEGAERVSDAAVDALVEYLEADADAVAKKAIEYATIAKRQTVKAEDIQLAIGSPETPESPDGEKLHIFDVIKDVIEATEKGQGFEDIIKSIFKFEKK